jgi:hypothetical protein
VHAVYETKGHHFALKELPNKEWETVEVKIGATNEMFVTIEEGLKEKDAVVLNPRSHLDKMKLPEIEEITDREKLAAIAKMPLGKGDSDGPGGGAKGSGGNPAAAVAAIFSRVDSDGDGKISKEEAAADERMAAAFATNDKNSDGSIDKAELLSSFAQRAGGKKGGSGKGGGGPRGEGGGGPGGEGGGPRGEGFGPGGGDGGGPRGEGGGGGGPRSREGN